MHLEGALSADFICHPLHYPQASWLLRRMGPVRISMRTADDIRS